MKSTRCQACGVVATWEPFRGCFVHPDDPSGDHDVVPFTPRYVATVNGVFASKGAPESVQIFETRDDGSLTLATQIGINWPTHLPEALARAEKLNSTTMLVAFDESPCWRAFDTGKRWNGAVVCMVDVDVRAEIVKWLHTMPESSDAAREIAALPITDMRMVEIGDGFTLHEVVSDEHAPCGDCGGSGSVATCGRCGSTITVR